MFNNLELSFQNAEKRLGVHAKGNPERRLRSDSGTMRLSSSIADKLTLILSGQERPSLKRVTRELEKFRKKSRPRIPARATIYKFMRRASTQKYTASTLPTGVQAALYNLAPDSIVPGHQVAFYCFNYGDLHAISFAAGLPWLSLYQASRLRGFRPKSRGLLEAVLRVRNI